MNVTALYLPRTIIIIICVIFSIIVLGLCADLANFYSHLNLVADFVVMGLVTSILSILSFPALMIVPHFVHLITELVVVLILWILWVVTAALTIQAKDALVGDFNCGVFSRTGGASQCNEIVAVEGFSITIFVLLMFYMLALFVYALMAHFRNSNRGVWTQRMNHGRNNKGPLNTTQAA